MSKSRKSPKRVTRSISFEGPLLDYVKKRAAAEKRSPNWYVNELVRKDLGLK